MTFRRICIALLALQAMVMLYASWTTDVLGNGFEMRHCDQGNDYSGHVISTIVRKQLPDSSDRHRGVLYIHGFNDYFFQAAMADSFLRHGYDFYAVDLRKYGRSLTDGQKAFQVRRLDEYFPDIDSALTVMKADGIDSIVIMGHSTGGLVSSYYLSKNHPDAVCALILNSPFLDWNLSRTMERLVPLVAFWGKIFPNTHIRQGDSEAYSSSLLESRHGEWTYDTTWKLVRSPDVDAGWINAINSAQHALRKKGMKIDLPILLLYSDNSVGGSEWSEAHNHGDGVLDVADIRKYGSRLGPDVTCDSIPGGMHDLALSQPLARNIFYRTVFDWLDRTVR